MFEELFSGEKSRVIVVKGDGKEKTYAQMLNNILSKFPDIELSLPMTESEYKKTFLTAEAGKKPKSSTSKMIFFGNGEQAKLQGKSVQWVFDKYGMKYGWLGNRCVITANSDELPLDKQAEFGEYFNSELEKVRAFLDDNNLNISSAKYSKMDIFDMNEMIDEVRFKEDDENFEKAAKVTAAVVASPLLALAKVISVINNSIEGVKASVERQDIWEKQYQLLILEFVVNGMQLFVNDRKGKEVHGLVTIVFDPKYTEYANLLQNLIQQYSNYDAMECTEKMFVDNSAGILAKNKIIFLGKTKSYKERWLDNVYKYTYNENGMCYGCYGNNAFIGSETLKTKDDIDAFIKIYETKRKSYENAAKECTKKINSGLNKNLAVGMNVANGIKAIAFGGIISVPISIAATIGLYSADIAKTGKELEWYQYQLVLREFVFYALKDFMEG